MATDANNPPIRLEGDRGNRDDDLEESQVSENTPLLPRSDDTPDQSQPHRERSAEALLRTLSDGNGKGGILKRRWPSFLALLILSLVVVLILVFAFFAPSIVEQYAEHAVYFEPTSLSIDSFTDTGVVARIQGNFGMDASRVEKSAVRNLGRFGTWIARYAESGESEVEVMLPEEGNVILGTAQVPKVKVDVRNGHVTHVDFLSELEPGSKEGIRRIADKYIEGRLGQIRVLGKAEVPIKSGLFSFGTQTIRKDITFANKDMPKIPGYDIKKLNFHDMEGGMEADVRLAVDNKYPLDFSVPSLGFQVLVEGCVESDPYILVADAATKKVHIEPKEEVKVDVKGMVRKLPNMLTQDCPGSDKSPLDVFVGNYIRGKENTVYVRGARSPSDDTPKWVEDLITDIVVPVPLPGKETGHLIRNFSLSDTKFNLPDPFAPPGKPEANPRISANIKAIVDIPEEMNFDLSANRVRADADIFYKGSKLGTLDLHKWQKATSKRIEEDDKPGLLVESKVNKAPVNITDEDVFADVIQALMFGSKSVIMDIKADVDVQIETAVGEFAIRRIPAEGRVPVKRR